MQYFFVIQVVNYRFHLVGHLTNTPHARPSVIYPKVEKYQMAQYVYSCCAFVFFSLPRGPILLEELWLVQTPVPQLVVFHHRLYNEGSGGTLLLFFKRCFLLFSIQSMFFSFFYSIVVCSLFNRCFPRLALQWRLLRHVSAFYHSISSIYTRYARNVRLYST